MRDLRCTFPSALDETAAKAYGVTAPPATFVIDASGDIAFERTDFDGLRLEPMLTEQIGYLLEEASGRPAER